MDRSGGSTCSCAAVYAGICLTMMEEARHLHMKSPTEAFSQPLPLVRLRVNESRTLLLFFSQPIVPSCSMTCLQCYCNVHPFSCSLLSSLSHLSSFSSSWSAPFAYLSPQRDFENNAKMIKHAISSCFQWHMTLALIDASALAHSFPLKVLCTARWCYVDGAHKEHDLLPHYKVP